MAAFPEGFGEGAGRTSTNFQGAGQNEDSLSLVLGDTTLREGGGGLWVQGRGWGQPLSPHLDPSPAVRKVKAMRQGKLLGMGRAVEGLLEEGHEEEQEEEGEGRVFPTELAHY